MKKVLFMTAIAVCSYIGASAQATFGVRAGLSGANLKSSFEGIDVTYDTKLGFYAGLLAELPVSENIAVQPELLYNQMGAQSGDGDETNKLLLDYISLPILVKYRNQGFSAFVGPQVSYLLSAKSKAGGESMDQKDGFKSIDFLGVIGAGYTLMNGFGFDARYQMGFANIADTDSEDEGSTKNNGFQVGVHYFFNRQ